MTSQVKHYMDQLWTLGRSCYDDMEMEEKMKLAGLIMREASSSYRAEFVIETQQFDNIAFELSLLMIDEINVCDSWSVNESITRKAFFANKFLAAAAAYAKPPINRLFETYTQGVQNNEQEQSD
jgi:hypothetical protein